jgi:hypothetical protein
MEHMSKTAAGATCVRSVVPYVLQNKGLRSMISHINLAVRSSFKPFEERPDLCFGKALAVGVELRH